ncbi:MAG: M6 family metalloprotease domain-containing protein [Fibrobacter sp.]|nr:M6 family metalloprotease domain-containing protein [Fibrobacter sp.]
MRLLRIVCLLLALAPIVWSMPAANHTFTKKQPDGSTIEVRNRGNESFHYIESANGTPLTKDSTGFLRPAKERPRPPEGVRINPNPKPLQLETTSSNDVPPVLRLPKASSNLTAGERNVLVVLVQFQDTKFSTSNPQEIFNNLLNKEGYTENGNIGSIRDYFIENSMGVFKPNFTVVGPVTVSGYNYRDYGEHSTYGVYGAQLALEEALKTLKKQGFDFTKFDNDNDKVIDYVHMIYAGYGSHDSDQEGAIWPHKWLFVEPPNLGSSWMKPLYVNEYSCNSELDGYAKQMGKTKIFGVGNFIHEFSHLLGLPDLYSTDGGNYTLGEWDVMDMGAYNTANPFGPLGTEPPYYSTFERLSFGWIKPVELSTKGSVKLLPVNENEAFRITNPSNSDEFFLLEYRVNKNWDAGLPSRGLLIWHIDYKKDIWDSARVNNDKDHQHVDLVEADGTNDSDTRSFDSFTNQGWRTTTEFNKFILWDGTDLNISLSRIAEAEDNTYITFNVDMNIAESSSSVASSSSATISSSSVESSSSAESSSSQEMQINSVAELAVPQIIKSGNAISVYNLPEGQKTVSLISMNGNILLSETSYSKNINISNPQRNEATLLVVKIGRQVLISKRIQ